MLKILALLLSMGPALAQPQTEYVPPDAELWAQITQAMREVSMPAAAHDAVQRILMAAEQQARQKAAKNALPKPPEKK